MDVENRAGESDVPTKPFSLWPTRFLGPMPGLKEINLACWCLAGAIFLTRFCLPVWLQVRAGAISIPLQPNDFVYFYGIGHIVKDYPPASLYDYSLQEQTFNSIYSAPNYVYGP